MPNKYILLLVVLGVSMGSVWLYGNAKYNQGKSDEKALCVLLNAKAGEQSHKDWNDISKKLQDTSKEDDLDYLRSLGGIVRKSR